jgi:hypothetical protein
MTHIYPTPKQETIINYIYQFRFLNRIQIQTLMHHKDYKRINAWLKELTEANFLGRIYSKKLLENTKPAIYYLSGKGIKLIHEKHKIPKEQLKKYYEDKNRSQRFMDHCLFLAEFYLIYLSQKDPTNTVKFFTKAQLTDYEYFPHPLPDGYIAIESKEKTNIKRYFLEVFDEGIPRFALKARMKQYISYADEGEWEVNTDTSPFPIILLVCPTEQMKKYLHRYIPKLLEEKYVTMRFYLSTRDAIRTQDIEKGAWEEMESY